jgi:hypothetical protein
MPLAAALTAENTMIEFLINFAAASSANGKNFPADTLRAKSGSGRPGLL